MRAAGRAVIDLGAGEPDFPTPQYVVDATRNVLDAGPMRYTQVEGILPLRQVIAEQASALHGGERIDAHQVVVTAGTKQALFNACFALFGPGDDVLVPTPGWTSYYEMLTIARARPVRVCGSLERQLKITPDDLLAVATPRTRGLMLNSPCNPTGAVYSKSELEEIVALAAERGWWIVSDEIYRAISYDGEATSLLAVTPDLERLVVVNGVAKSFAMTGWRIGWSITTPALASTMTALQSHTTSNAATLAQHATLAALSDRDASSHAIHAMVSELRARRDDALAILRTAGTSVIEPRGAFYLYIHAGPASSSDPEPGTSFANRLLEEREVAVVPGVAFRTPEWFRVSYAAPREQVLEGVRRIVSARIS